MWLYKYYSNVTFDEKILTNGVRGAIMQFVNEVVSRKQTHTKIIKVLNLKGGNTKMKKFISLALAAAMTLSLVPVSAFASTDNRISNVVTVEKDTELKDVTSIPKIQITDDKEDLKDALKDAEATVAFELVLDGAEWVEDNMDNKDVVENATQVDATFEKLTSTRALVTLKSKNGDAKDDFDGVSISLKGVKVTSDTAKVTIDPKNTTVSANTFTFAKSVNGGAIITVDGTKDFYDGNKVNDIVIEEVVADTIKSGDKIKLKLNSGFTFNGKPTVEVVSGAGTTSTIPAGSVEVDGRDVVITVGSDNLDAGKVSIIKISDIAINEDGADFGKVAEITVSSNNFDTTTVEMGKLVDFGVSITAEDKDLPTIYSGMKAEDDENETLVLTVKENVANSWLAGSRKTTFTFPEGVKVKGVKVDDNENCDKPSDLTGSTDSNDDFAIDGNEVTLKSLSGMVSTKKASLSLIFDVIVAPDYTGDITCTVGGAAVGEETKVTLAKAVAPITVEAAKTSVAIDYRNVSVGDITISEAKAGLWDKKDVIVLEAENMQFESGMKAEVVEGDGEIKKLDVTKGKITITVDSESSKTPMKIKLSNASLYLDRSLPAGDYALKLTDGLMFETYNEKDGNKPATTTEFGFDVDEVTVMKDYVTVATAGRDQGTTFTTEVAVTIDSTTMLVDGKEKTLDVPAYLSAEGWTMLPVRAVTEALATSSNSQPIDWIAGNPGTIMIYYGDKTVAMTLGSTTMYINGTPVPMSTAPVIVNDRAFLPMRDLGRALGLSDDQIKWDATTRTATFNPAATTTK